MKQIEFSNKNFYFASGNSKSTISIENLKLQGQQNNVNVTSYNINREISALNKIQLALHNLCSDVLIKNFIYTPKFRDNKILNYGNLVWWYKNKICDHLNIT